MSLAVSAGAVRPPPCLLMPLLLDSSPPSLTVVCTSSPLHRVDRQHDQAVVEQQRVAGLHVARQLLVVQAHRVDVAQLGARGVEHERLRRARASTLPSANLPTRIFGPCRSAMIATSLPGALGRVAHHRRAVDVVLRRAVAEVQPHDVDAGARSSAPASRVAGRGRAERGDDLGFTSHGVTFEGRRRAIIGASPATPRGPRAIRRHDADASRL